MEFQSTLATEATNESLEEFFVAHSEATTEQIGRLETVFEEIPYEIEASRRDSETLEGIIEDREPRIADVENPDLADLIDLETARTIERLELAKLETLLDLSGRLRLDQEVTEPLQTTRFEVENALEDLEGMPTG
ncbi:DUF892 family protein [Natrialbaceae archaeon A-gly3]